MRRLAALVSSPSRRGLLLVAGGTAMGQLISSLAYLVLPRLYSPSDMSLLATFTSMSAILGTIAAARYDLAVPLPVGDQDAARIVKLGLMLSLFTALLGTVLVLFFGDHLNRLIGVAAPGNWLWAVPWVAAAYSAYVMLNQWAVRRGDFRAIGQRNIVQSVVMVAVQLGAGFAGFRPGGLPLGYGMAQGFGALTLARSAMLFGRSKPWGSARSMAKQAWLYRRCPSFLAPAGLFNIAAAQVPVLIFSAYYTRDQTGWMGFTQRVLTLPIGLIGVAVAQVYLSNASSAKREGRDSYALFTRASKRLLLVGVLIGVPLLCAGPWIFGVLFGQSFYEAGYYAQALAVGVTAQFIGSPLSQTLIIHGRHVLQLVWDAGYFILVCGGVWLCASRGLGPRTAAWVMGLTSAAAFVTAWWLSYRTLRREARFPNESSI